MIAITTNSSTSVNACRSERRAVARHDGEDRHRKLRSAVSAAMNTPPG
jgi:hypothetical protein